MIANNFASIPDQPMLRALQPADGSTAPSKACSAVALFGPSSRRAKRLLSCLGQDQANDLSRLRGRSHVSCLAQHDVCRSIRENESGAKTKPRRAKTIAFLCDDDAKSSTRYSGEREDKQRPRQAISCQSQDNRQMESAGAHIRRENGSKESPFKPPHAPRRSDHSCLPVAHPPRAR